MLLATQEVTTGRVLRLDDWLPDIQELPALPAAVTRLLAALDAPNSSARDIARIIESDQALVTKVLRLANSAAYGTTEKVTTVHRATVRLGMGTLKGLALSYGLYLSLSGPNRDLLDAHFWAHSVAAGLAAQEIARRTRMPDAEEAFIIGLLHDVGQVLLAYWFQSDYRALVREQRQGSVPLDILETRRLGVSHAAVGAAFLKHWGLPATLVHAVEFHHELYRVPATIKRYPALAELADTAAQRAGYYGLGSTNPNRAYSLGALRLLRTTEAALKDIEVFLQEEVPRQAGLLRIAPPAAHSAGLLPSEAA
ncbi:MAG: hypothetical protein GEEBNDBF_02306 [bacterium]|nr:hypothetical protein [bacterium]